MKKIIVMIDEEGKVDIEEGISTQEAGAIANAAVNMIKEGAFVGNYVSVNREHSLYGMLESEDEKMFPISSLLENIEDEDISPSRVDLERMESCGIWDIVLGAE